MRRTKRKTKQETDLQDVLKTWDGLNKFLMDTTEEMCQQLLDAEIAGKKRNQITMRIYSRFSKLRRERERNELVARMGE